MGNHVNEALVQMIFLFQMSDFRVGKLEDFSMLGGEVRTTYLPIVPTAGESSK